MKHNFSTRGEAFIRVIRRLADKNRRVGDDIMLFDEYTVAPLMMKPLRTAYTVAVNVLEGKGKALVNSVEYDFRAPCLLVFVPGQVFQLTDCSDMPVKTRVMILSEKFMQEFNGMSFRMNEIFSTLLINPVIDLDSNGNAYLENYVSSCRLTISDTGNPRRYDIIHHLTVALFYGALIGICDRNQNTANRPSRICAQFISLLKEHFAEEHKLEFYASSLFVTTRYLSICVKSVTGKTPAFWIDYHLLSEAKRMIRETDLTIDRISENLGFVSQSVFGKFFKRLAGCSPTEYRNLR